MLGSSVYISQSRWHYPIVIMIAVLLVGWYFINMKRASAKNSFVAQKKFELSTATTGTLSLLTYNVAGLPQIISAAHLPRAQSIGDIGHKVSRFDIVNVQEDFNYNNDLYQHNIHPFRTEPKGKVPFGDGLNTLSNFPILASYRVAWRDCAGTDCLTPKGFAYLRVQIAKDVFVDVYNLHATAHINDNAVAARRKNMQQLADYILEHSADQAILVMGDFNAHYKFEGDDMHGFKKKTGVTDPWVDLFSKGVIPQPSSDFLIPKKLELTDEIESIDKILYRSSQQITFIPQRYRIEHELFVNEAGKHLSDHLAVSLYIDWEYTRSSSLAN